MLESMRRKFYLFVQSDNEIIPMSFRGRYELIMHVMVFVGPFNTQAHLPCRQAILSLIFRWDWSLRGHGFSFGDFLGGNGTLSGIVPFPHFYHLKIAKGKCDYCMCGTRLFSPQIGRESVNLSFFHFPGDAK